MYRISPLTESGKFTHSALKIAGLRNQQAGSDVEALVESDVPVLITSSVEQGAAVLGIDCNKIKKPKDYYKDDFAKGVSL